MGKIKINVLNCNLFAGTGCYKTCGIAGVNHNWEFSFIFFYGVHETQQNPCLNFKPLNFQEKDFRLMERSIYSAKFCFTDNLFAR